MVTLAHKHTSTRLREQGSAHINLSAGATDHAMGTSAFQKITIWDHDVSALLCVCGWVYTTPLKAARVCQ